jgi:hypothetical protein
MYIVQYFCLVGIKEEYGMGLEFRRRVSVLVGEINRGKGERSIEQLIH